MMRDSEIILKINNLNVSFKNRKQYIPVVRDVSFFLEKGQTLAVVGESGSGKSVTCLASLGLTPKPPNCLVTGQAIFNQNNTSVNLLKLSRKELLQVRGSKISMIFQEPMTSLNPLHKVGHQISESIKLHTNLSNKEINKRVIELLEIVGISDPEIRVSNYPHQLSGGMRQRIMIAIALSCNPSLLIADEPTTALDVTIQAQIIDLLKKLQQEYGMAIIFITHNMGVVAEIADHVLVMYAGQVVEKGTVTDIFYNSSMPYTKGLLESIPSSFGVLNNIKLKSIIGNVPDPLNLPKGCAFSPRCHYRKEKCQTSAPDLELIDDMHSVRCLFYQQINQKD